MDYRINQVSSKDLPLLQRLFYETVTIYGSQLFSKNEIRLFMKLALDKGFWKSRFAYNHIYVAKLHGEIIGSFSLSPVGTIDYIFVHKDYQDKGLATDLYKLIEELAQKNGITILSAFVSHATKDFFEKRNFKILETLDGEIGRGNVPELKAVKKVQISHLFKN